MRSVKYNIINNSFCTSNVKYMFSICQLMQGSFLMRFQWKFLMRFYCFSIKSLLVDTGLHSIRQICLIEAQTGLCFHISTGNKGLGLITHIDLKSAAIKKKHKTYAPLSTVRNRPLISTTGANKMAVCIGKCCHC